MDMASQPASGLTHAHELLCSAIAEPLKYLGPQICRASLWAALLFTIEVTADVLGGDAYSLGEDAAAFSQMLLMDTIASAARFALKPKKNPDDAAAFAAERRGIAAFQSTVHLRIGCRAAGTVSMLSGAAGFIHAVVALDASSVTDFSVQNPPRRKRRK